MLLFQEHSQFTDGFPSSQEISSSHVLCLCPSLFSHLQDLNLCYVQQDPLQLAEKQMPSSLIFEVLQSHLLEKLLKQWYWCEDGGRQTADVELVRVWTQNHLWACSHCVFNVSQPTLQQKKDSIISMTKHAHRKICTQAIAVQQV